MHPGHTIVILFLTTLVVLCSSSVAAYGAVQNFQEQSQITFLSPQCIEAIESGDIGSIKILLADSRYREMLIHGIDPAEERDTALMKSASRNHYQIVRLLLENDADPDVMDSFSRTATMIAASLGCESALRELLRHPKYFHMRTALAVPRNSSKSNDVAEISNLSIDARDKYGRTALLWACYSGNINTVQILLESGSNIDLGDYDNRTPLMWAATSSRGFPIVRLLLERGADVRLRDRSGTNVLGWAMEAGKRDVATLVANRLYGA